MTPDLSARLDADAERVEAIRGRVGLTCDADDCGEPIPLDSGYYAHVRLGANVHPACRAMRTVRGEDVSTHTVMLGRSASTDDAAWLLARLGESHAALRAVLGRTDGAAHRAAVLYAWDTADDSTIIALRSAFIAGAVSERDGIRAAVVSALSGGAE